jgi:Na+-translocating ferredoxin:NAD+ oxidoreductase RnfD subunit
VNFKYIFNEFKSQVAFVLLLVWLLAVWNFRTVNVVAYPLFAVVLTTLLDLIISRLRTNRIYWPSASFVTGMLIGLILAPAGSFLPIVTASSAAVFSKQFINTGIRQHIFNPAAFGIIAASLAFNVAVAWWAVAWGYLPLVVLIPAMARILWRMKRFWLPATFLAVYLVYYLIQFGSEAPRLLIDGSLLLFALVMLPEPITSPIAGKFKYVFGALAALVAIAFSYTGMFAEVFLPALVAANLGSFLLRKFSSGKSAQSASKSPEAKKGQ